MKLLVTGGAGFIGSNLIHHIIDRPEVSSLVNLDCLTYAGHLENVERVASHPKYIFERIDLRDQAAVLEAVQRHAITHVLHLAADSHVDRSIRVPDDFIQTNVLGTFHLLEACRASWPTDPTAHPFRFVHVSTDEVFGSIESPAAFLETSPYAPNSPYSASKAGADLLVRAYHRTYGLPTVITNSSNNYGPYQFPEKLIPVVIQCLRRREPIPVYGDGLHVRDWLHVLDHADALWTALRAGAPGETYNIGGRNQRTNLELVELLCDLFDELRPEFGGNSRALIAFVAERPGHDRRYAVDCSKAERGLGWRPVRSFNEGLRETVRWYLENPAWTERVLAAAAQRRLD